MSQNMHKEANKLVENLHKQLATQQVKSKVEQKCAVRLLADAMRENSAKDERIVRLREDVSKTGIEASTANMLDLVTQQLSTLEEQTIFAHRAAEDVLELLVFEEKKYANLSQANRELANKLGQSQMEVDISGDEKAGLQGELIEACRDLEVTQENARLWQMVAEKRLNELSPEE
jgi:hypothetical protein